jgi:hypothetical protein
MNEAPKVRSLAAIRLELEELSREVEEFARDLIDSGHANAPTYAAASATIRAATTIQAHVRVGAHIRAEAHVIQAEPEQSSLPSVPPSWSSFVLACVASKGRAEELLGDAHAEYRQMIETLGAERARWWYRVYVAKLVARMLPGAIMRVLLLHKVIGMLGF